MPRTPPTSVSIIVPTYREAENLPELLPTLAATLRARGWLWEVIVIDDNSPDATAKVLTDLHASIPEIRWKIRLNERGLSSAVIAGIAMSKYDYVVVMDADLSHPPEAVPALVDRLLSTDSDFVIGSRYVLGGKTEDWGFLRWLNSAGATLLAKPLVGTVRDPMAGFFGLRRDSLQNAATLNPIGYKIALELMVKCGARRVSEVPIIFRNRRHGESKLTLKEQFRYLEHLSRLYDYTFPKASPRVKFLVAAACGAAACLATVLGLERLGGPASSFAPAMACGLLALTLVTLAFFLRYVRAQRDFILMRHPYLEFLYISLAEAGAGWLLAVMAGPQLATSLRVAAGVAGVLLVRYTLRKVFLHDLRGIHGKPSRAGQIVFDIATAAAPAASA